MSSEWSQPPKVSAVYFDIGETVLDRSREYAAWAAFLGLPSHTFSAVFGAIVSRGGGVSDVLHYLRPSESVGSLRDGLQRSGLVPPLTDEDLYPGVRILLKQLRAAGLAVGIVGNQPLALGEQLRRLDLDADVVAVSAEWGLEKPDPRFFQRCVQTAGCASADVLYVGDQLDNDVRGALAAGLQVVRVRSGPWGLLTGDDELEARCLAVIDSIADLADVLDLEN
ncbi:HAD superfamily hydrolase (TIGR01509 family)/HAD superfamily hydrolase (TIGR01549 family) [Jatrophihabitans sp. GAS493]|uniref:HAD family hydrolase n=1 Tax=Jatrophihabitans sp. GAS493 TaxID=1907575 RepID=UPI000BB94032|nr:HAD-IA family hydrolase [Jatrophihabitans sp. GAS493]SOD71452.1 HAD superfamily hydrolase (TIGR01509 family)/HAD superfamily hydrolase (TIGR01549 family) [Jatrophihabitans sp. GAS493]